MQAENPKTPTGGDDFEAATRLVDTRGLLVPCTSDEAAELLNMSPGTLKNQRSKGNGPPGWVIVPGVGGRYRSKLDVLRWWWKQHDLASNEHSQRGRAS